MMDCFIGLLKESTHDILTIITIVIVCGGRIMMIRGWHHFLILYAIITLVIIAIDTNIQGTTQ